MPTVFIRSDPGTGNIWNMQAQQQHVMYVVVNTTNPQSNGPNEDIHETDNNRFVEGVNKHLRTTEKYVFDRIVRHVGNASKTKCVAR